MCGDSLESVCKHVSLRIGCVAYWKYVAIWIDGSPSKKKTQKKKEKKGFE